MMMTTMTILLRFILDLRSHSSPCAVYFFSYIFHVAIMGLCEVFGDVLMHLMSRYERFHLSEVDFWGIRWTSGDQAANVLRGLLSCLVSFCFLLRLCSLCATPEGFHMLVL